MPSDLVPRQRKAKPGSRERPCPVPGIGPEEASAEGIARSGGIDGNKVTGGWPQGQGFGGAFRAERRPGMGVGLRNVAERLRLRFQHEGRFLSGPVTPGRYRAFIDLPWRLA